jgi:putative nucleotidyltransferase with HDIG domain
MSIVKLSIDEALCVPIIVGPVVAGFLYLDNRGADAMTIAASKASASTLGGQHADDDSADFATGLAKLSALALSNLMRQDVERRHTSERQSLFMGAVRSLVAAIDAKDPYTRGHSERVAHLSSGLALAMGLDPESVERVRITGLVHDVGKIGVPDDILRKPGALTDAEFDAIKQHPVLGARILRSVPFLARHIPIVELHHERPDGRGYPTGLRGDDIPLAARIVHVADAYDAMTSARAYRGARPSGDALRELWRCAGTEFHAEIVGALATALPGVTSDTGDVVLARV